MKNILLLARKEIQEGLRNRWVLATTLLLAARALDVVIVSLSSLTIFLLPLIALLISHDAIVGEMERGTMLLLLSYPVGRWQIVVGKFLGHIAILGFATLVGYGAAALALLASGAAIAPESWPAFAAMIASSVLLGAVFVAIGYLISTLATARGMAAGIAVGVWLVFVLIYDMALLGVLVADQGATVSGDVLNVLLLLNPTDAYRLLNLSSFANVSQFSGMAGLAGQTGLSGSVLLAALAGWVAVPLLLATLVFARREV